MKLRIARKILNAPREEDGGSCHRYRDDQLGRALRRIEKTATEKSSKAAWYRLMDALGVEGRAWIVGRRDPARALRMLCEQGEGLSFGKAGTP